MGAYLNKPITEKHSESGGNETIKFAATSMQGWRVNQEDAHNCILDLENGWHLFAVYDGHGGPEVAKYTSANFPKFFRDREVWKADDIVKLLQDTFVDFDDHLRTDPVMMELKKIANGVEGDKKVDSDDDEDDEDKAALLEEGAAPLEQLLKKYGYEIVSNGSTTRVMRHITDVANEHLAEARAAGKKEEGGDSEDGEGSSSDKSHKRPNESPRLQRAKRAKSEVNTEEQDVEEEEATKENGAKEAKGDGKSEEEKTETETENGAGDTEKEPVLKKGKNTVPVVAKKESALDDVDVNSSDDEDYKEGEEEDGADEEEDEEESEDGEGEEQDDEEEDEEEEDEDMGEDAFGGLSGASFGPTGETPGEDSGTTACVCIVAPGKVIVANAGDSRAVLSRGGKAVDLSIDHKPEDQIEMDRITKAGGVVNEDGRVNGGLNLSRALGDHCYKKNKTLPLREQMISALPDVKILETTEEDDFIVVACDGIWNSLESQQVIDFVKERLGKGMGLTAICEEMCTECLADSTSGDGTGCDNMTIIIADLKPTTRAAPAAEEKEEAVEV
ncbi:hypothetical protein PMAYCL1PPCAC_11100 [Pristionchus mayeri]|uniref:protein-serine/threonine phosphatase n=1 Tax=Pristionchus mayeri TaxID=1317129 RepID=A0AAN4ZPQ2_9BILA|nr:hypothetical protein PMAYCL1PPCAC_11100 [Pristionchus mayeri]